MNTNPRALRILLLTSLAIAANACAQPTTRIAVQDLKPLLVLAIDHGTAHGTLVGEAAAFLRKRFGTDAPIEIDVRTVRNLRDLACRRLEVTTRQAGVVDRGAPENRHLTYQLNYCRDGRMPQRD